MECQCCTYKKQLEDLKTEIKTILATMREHPNGQLSAHADYIQMIIKEYKDIFTE